MACTNCNKDLITVRGTTLCFNCYVERLDREEGKKPGRKAARAHEEDDIQKAFFTAVRYKFPKLDKLIFAVPNGGWRRGREAARFKAQGVVPGVADVLCLVPNGKYNYLCLECKTPKGVQSGPQKAFQGQVEKAGGLYVIFRSVEEGLKVLEDYLNE